MSHTKHAHAHCAHAHLSFCAICQVVYCHDCAQEWTPKQTWFGTGYTYTLPNTTIYPTTAGLTTTGHAGHTHGS